MKKLILLFTILTVIFSNNAFSKWELIEKRTDGNEFYLDPSSIRGNNGFINYSYLNNLIKPIEGIKSVTNYAQGDCKAMRFKRVNVKVYKKPMAQVILDSRDNIQEEWRYPRLNSSMQKVLRFACDLHDIQKTISYESKSKITRTLSYEKTRPYAKKCAKIDKDISGSYKFFKGFINDDKTHSDFYGDKARQAKVDNKESFSVIIIQEFKNVAGDTRYRVSGCEFTLDEGMQIVYKSSCNSFSSHIPFISKTGLKKNFEEFFFYRDQIIIAHKRNMSC